MRIAPQVRTLPDGRRLHLQHGPIDLIVGADGSGADRQAGLRAAARRFATILDELCGELPLLRRPVDRDDPPQGAVGRTMADAVEPFAAETFITPMAAVAGAVADAVLAAMTETAPVSRAYVNNGGDIALHLSPGATFRLGLVDRPDRPNLFGTASIRADHGVGGVATSGWRGRSFSLGIADAVTILARTAAQADAAATIVANAVDLPGHPAVLRAPACDIQPDSDLGDRLVTRDVGPLRPDEIDQALEHGLACARRLLDRGLIRAAALHCAGATRALGALGPLATPSSQARPVQELAHA